MDGSSYGSERNSRKRLRAEDRSGSTYKLSTSPAMSHVKDSHPRSGNASGQNDLALPSSTENAPILQPLHPPIPNFSAISQGAPRPNSVPASNGDPPNNLIYNIALPLPNPGRAHRFCQACDHINHVRRKLCEKCGAPKPSAVRNAVGVRSANESDASRERRPRPTIPDSYGFDGLNEGFSRPMPNTQVATQSTYSRQSSHNNLATDQKGNRSVDLVIHQAHPLTMRCPGDEIPLLGSTQKTQSSYQIPDSQASQRLGQTLLSEPLISFGPIQNQDPRQQRAALRQNVVGGTVDLSQNVFPGYPLDRDQLVLPSMNGIPGQPQSQVAYLGQTGASRRASQLDLSSHPGGLSHGGKGADGGLPEEVISLSRNTFIPELDTRQGASRFQNLQGLRQAKAETVQQLPESLDGQGTTTYTYPSGHDFFVSHSHVRSDERIALDESRTRDNLATSDSVIGAKSNISLCRYMEHNADGEDRNRGAPGMATTRAKVMTTLQLQRVSEQQTSGHLDDSSRQTDEGRIAIENILMQHKSGRSTQG